MKAGESLSRSIIWLRFIFLIAFLTLPFLSSFLVVRPSPLEELSPPRAMHSSRNGELDWQRVTVEAIVGKDFVQTLKTSWIKTIHGSPGLYKLTFPSGMTKIIVVSWLDEPQWYSYAIQDEALLAYFKNIETHWMKIKEIEHILVECFVRAFQSFNWNISPCGFMIETGNNFNSAGPLNARVGDKEVRALVEDLKKGDSKLISARKAHLTASFAHEFVHQERDEILGGHRLIGECITQLMQLLIDPKDNVIFNRLVDHVLTEVERFKNSGELRSSWKDHDKALWMGLVILTQKLQERSPVITSFLKEDTDDYKLATLRRMLQYLVTLPYQELTSLRKEIMDEIMFFGEKEVMDLFFLSADTLGIDQYLIVPSPIEKSSMSSMTDTFL